MEGKTRYLLKFSPQTSYQLDRQIIIAMPLWAPDKLHPPATSKERAQRLHQAAAVGIKRAINRFRKRTVLSSDITISDGANIFIICELSACFNNMTSLSFT